MVVAEDLVKAREWRHRCYVQAEPNSVICIPRSK